MHEKTADVEQKEFETCTIFPAFFTMNIVIKTEVKYWILTFFKSQQCSVHILENFLKNIIKRYVYPYFRSQYTWKM